MRRARYDERSGRRDGLEGGWQWNCEMPGYVAVRALDPVEFPYVNDWLVAPLKVSVPRMRDGVVASLEDAYQGRAMDAHAPVPVAVMKAGQALGSDFFSRRSQFDKGSSPSPSDWFDFDVNGESVGVHIDEWGLWSRAGNKFECDAFAGGDWEFVGSYGGSRSGAMAAAERADETIASEEGLIR